VQAALGGGTSALPPAPPQQGEGGEKSSKGKGEQASEGKDKDAIFRYQMDWAAIDRHQVVERKMRAWVVKKIKEYLGEEETTLIKFIMHHLAAHCKPEDLLTELRLVLEDDADIFVEKLWKVLIYHMVNAGQ
jgi:RNA-binding protein 25